MKKGLGSMLFFLLIISAAFATEAKTEDTNEDGKPDRWIETNADKGTVIRSDRNYDGEIDHVLEIDESAQKVYESMDFNFDGEMDDFSFYERGVLQSREIDTNYDTDIDLWVYMHKGVYVKKVERDTDFDGEIDYVKDYEEL